jgi:hypothetical protein
MRKPTNAVHGHIIWLTDSISSHHQNIIAHTIVTSSVQLQHKCITNPSITHTGKVMQALAECAKAIQGMTGKARNSQAAQNLQPIVDATQACVQTNPHQFEETVTPYHFHNMQQVPKGQAPASIPIPHTNDNRQITCSMQMQAPILRVPTDVPRFKPISAPCVATNPPIPTTLAAESSKHERQRKQQASRLRNAVTPTSPTTRIRTQAQVATAAAQVTPPSLNTRSRMQHSGMPPPIGGPLEKTLPRRKNCGKSHFFVQPSLLKILSMPAQNRLRMFFAIFLFVPILATRPCCQ